MRTPWIAFCVLLAAVSACDRDPETVPRLDDSIAECSWDLAGEALVCPQPVAVPACPDCLVAPPRPEPACAPFTCDARFCWCLLDSGDTACAYRVCGEGPSPNRSLSDRRIEAYPVPRPMARLPQAP